MTTFLASLDMIQSQYPALYFWIDMFLKGSLLVLIATVSHWLYRRQSASSHSFIWLTALLGCLLLPVFKLLTPALEMHLSVAAIASPLQPGAASFTAPAFGAGEAAGTLPLAHIVAWLYLAGTLCMTAFLASGVAALAHLSRRAQPLPEHPANAILQALLEENGASTRVDLLFSPVARTPFTWGLLRHRLVLPVRARHWDRELLTQAIAHELGHIQRNDWLAQLLARLALCLYWPNPLVWHAVRRMKLTSEQACDDAAIDSCQSEVSYASNLLNLAGQLGRRSSLTCCAVTLLSRSSELGLRIRHILMADRNREFLRAEEIAIATLFTLLLVIPLSALTFSATAAAPETSSRTLIPVNMDLLLDGPDSPDLRIGQFQRESPALSPPRQIENHALTLPAPVTTSQVSGQFPAVRKLSALPESLDNNREFALPRQSLYGNWEATPLIVPEPAYPLQALRRGIEGHVVAEFRIGGDGRVTDTTIIESVPTGVFDDTVLRAIQQSVYCPEIVTGIGGNNQPIRKRFLFDLRDHHG